MINAATIPLVPLRPTADNTTEARMSVISVMPETGLEPTMAIALAATVVKRNAMKVTTRMATTANIRLCITPSQKKMNDTSRATIAAMAMNLNDRSFCVRTAVVSAPALPFSSLPANETALLMMPHDFTMPMMPAIAMPPMPMLRA